LPQIGDFLSRFRPAGAPGAASRAGVPADRAAELAGELGPVLALLDATQAECARKVADAEREAERVIAAARAAAEQIIADAANRAETARTRAATEVLDVARAQGAEAERVAAQRARERPRSSEGEVRALVSAAVELVRMMPEGGEGR
jgi:vacuolar-type H+-ATPase subunit H